jgi:hypothetical protein
MSGGSISFGKCVAAAVHTRRVVPIQTSTHYFFVDLPSMAVFQALPSGDSSNFIEYEVGESTFI